MSDPKEKIDYELAERIIAYANAKVIESVCDSEVLRIRDDAIKSRIIGLLQSHRREIADLETELRNTQKYIRPVDKEEA